MRIPRLKTIIIVVVIVLAGLLVWKWVDLRSAFREGYKTEPRFIAAMHLIQSDARVAAVLGGPPSEIGLFGYNVVTSTSDSHTEYGINLVGAKALGKADVVVVESNGNLSISSAVFQDDKGHLTNLLVKD